MIEILTGIGGSELALAAARIGTGAFFAISGYHKLFNPARHSTLVSTLKGDGIPLLGFTQWFVPAIEFSAGMAILTGFLAPLAAFGLLALLTVACITDGRKRVQAFAPIDGADRVDDWLYLPEITYILLLLLVLTHGAGRYSVDVILLTFL